MAITPFHKRSSSQEIPSQREANRPSTLSPSQQQRLRDSNPKSSSGLSKSNTIRSISSVASGNTTSLAKQYEADRHNLIKYCFSVYDNDGQLVENYITHVRIIEDSMYASNRPPPTSSPENKKHRILVLAAKADGTVFLHKGRENSNGSFQIGRTWSLNDLISIKNDLKVETGFSCCLGKDYYWETNSSRERQVFIGSFIRTYRKFKNGLLPILINWDLPMFGLDEESYKLFLNPDLIQKASASSPKKKKAEIATVVESSRRTASPEKPLNQKNNIVNAVNAATAATSAVLPIVPQTISKSNVSRGQVEMQNASQKMQISNKTSPKAMPASQSSNFSSNSVTKDLKKQPYPQQMRQTSPLMPQKSMRMPSPLNPKQQTTSPRLVQQQSFLNSPYQRYKESNTGDAKTMTSLPRSRSMLLDDLDLPPQDQKKPEINKTIVPLDLIAAHEEPVEQTLQKSEGKSLDSKLTPPSHTPTESSNNSSSIDLNVYQQDDDGEQNESFNEISRAKSAAHGVEIFTHSKSSREFHEAKANHDYLSESESEREPLKRDEVEPMNYDYQDDITDLYDNALDIETPDDTPAELPKLQIPQTMKFTNQTEITPIEQTQASFSPVADTTGDFSYDDSLDMKDKRTIPSHLDSINSSSLLLDSLDEPSSPTDSKPHPYIKDCSVQLQRFRTNSLTSLASLTSLESGLPKEATQESEYDDIFDQIRWDPTDDSTTIIEKLNAELRNVEYETTKSLIKISEGSKNMKASYERILKECENLNPIFDYFSVELSGLVYDIKDIEFEGKGLQVETSNKKKLWNDLQNLLNTISVDEKSLNFLLNADIDEDTANIESILSELESAILAIRGDKNKEDDLAEMKALKERGETYENFIEIFLSNIRKELDMRFKNILENLIEIKNPTYITLKNELSKLMVYSGITLFIKNVSKDALSDLSLIWQNDINPYYLNQLTIFGNRIASLVIEDSQPDTSQAKYSLTNPTFSRSPSPSGKTTSNEEQKKLRGQFGLTETFADDQFNEYGSGTMVYEHIVTSLKSLELNIMLQQDFLFKFFHMNNEDLRMTEFSDRFPIQSRDQMLLQSSKDVDEVDTNRDLAREIYHSIHNIFQPHLDKFVKLIGRTLKYHQNYTPLVLTQLQISQLRLNVTDQEFTAVLLKKLDEKLTKDWLRFVDSEISLIEKNSLAQKKIVEVSNIVKNFSRLIEDIDVNFKAIISENEEIDLEKLYVRKIINDSNNQFTRALLNNLQHELKSLTGSESNAIKNNTQSYDIDEADGAKFKYNQIVNIVQNSNYLLDSITALRLPQFNEFLNSVREVFNKSRDIYIGALMESVPHFNKIINFVRDVEEYLQETNRTSDPSKRNAYTKQTLEKLLLEVDVKYINQTISQLRTDINQDLIKGSVGTSETKNYQKSLIDKVWSSLQAEYVGAYINLESIQDKYYKEIVLRFTKRDLINAFNNSRVNG